MASVETFLPTARLALQDACYVRQLLEDETRRIEWRLFWTLEVTLLRTVGMALDRADAKKSDLVRSVSRRHYKSWQSEKEQHAIFFDFIKSERDSILHEYEFSITEGPVPIVVSVIRGDEFDNIRQFLLEENLYRPLGSGRYEGEDGRDVVDEAIEWWRVRLDEIDADIAKLAGATLSPRPDVVVSIE